MAEDLGKKEKGLNCHLKTKMSETQITANYERAVEVAKMVVGMLEQRVYPFDIPDLFPDAIVPEGIKAGSEQHRLLLFYACFSIIWQ